MRISTRWAWLVILLLLGTVPVAPPARAQRPEDDRLSQLVSNFREAYQKKDWPRAIDVGRKLVEVAPDNGVHAYNLACVYSLNGDTEEAAALLAKAADNGFARVSLVETDSDLDNLREHAGYQAALALVRTNQRKTFAGLRRDFLRAPPLVVLPTGHRENEPSPLIVALHGYGARARGMAKAWEMVADQIGAILVAPQAVHRVNGGTGFSWLARGDQSVDEADFLVKLTLEMVTKKFKIDSKRTVLTGFSQGGFVAHAVGAKQPYKFSGVIPMAGGYIPAIDAPAKATGDAPPRFYFMVGEHDRPLEQMRQAAEDFAAAGFDVKLRIYPGVGHTFPKNTVEELHDALEYVLER